MGHLKFIVLLTLLLSIHTSAQEIWQYELPGAVVGAPLLLEEQIVVTGGNLILGLDKSGNILWKRDLGSNSSAVVATDGTRLFVNAENGVHAFKSDGTPLWYFMSQDGVNLVEGNTHGWGKGLFPDAWDIYRSSPTVRNGIVYFGNKLGTFALDAKTGNQIWHLATGVTHTTPAIYKDILVVGSWNNHLYGVDNKSGQVRWKVKAKLPEGRLAGWQGWEGFNLSPIIHDGVAYVGSRGTYFYAIDVATGEERWSSKHPTSWVGSPAIEDEGEIYFGMSDGYTLVGLNAKNGNQHMHFKTGFYNFARPQVNSDFVFVGTMAGQIFAVNKINNTGKLIFKTPDCKVNCAVMLRPEGGMNFHFSPIKNTAENMAKDVLRMFDKFDSILSMTYSDGILYLGSAKGHIYAVDVSTLINS
ncbi:PQQ-binding-like beta-propeller repeat protein [Microbulbifer variabilis]|uniref:outer membrane protein assembly factor BamB family protein n=1 Tax=Microbulbifer variabilis TaxID=266805 RepID=UPI001CFDC8B9|nr:PQQ-binding-like beta-propeller repeat protein [Microbulbifer variabilis]